MLILEQSLSIYLCGKIFLNQGHIFDDKHRLKSYFWWLSAVLSMDNLTTH